MSYEYREFEAFRAALALWRRQVAWRYVHTSAGLIELKTRHMREEYLCEVALRP